jgi:hypothetical protein
MGWYQLQEEAITPTTYHWFLHSAQHTKALIYHIYLPLLYVVSFFFSLAVLDGQSDQEDVYSLLC